VWGHLVFTAADGTEQSQEFRFNLQTRQISLKKETGDEMLELDEMGVVVS